MAQRKLNSLEQFVLFFKAMKHAAKDDPEKLEVFYEQNVLLKKAADELYFFLGFGDFERRIFHGGKKYIPQAPDGFDKIWKEYEKNWALKLSRCVIKIDLSELLPETDVQSERNEPDLSNEDILEAPDPDFDTEFDPIHHEGGKAMEMAFWITENYAEEVGSEYEDTIHNASKIGLDAFDYLKNTIGFDASEVFRRWRQIPVIFMPARVSNKYGLVERGSIYELIDDAVRAYVFGAPAAAIAMCRAILEMILKQHYDLDYQYKDGKGNLRDKGLGALIILADERYKFIQGKRVRKLSDEANKIMHKYSARKKLAEEDERVILDFFMTNKFLIERAPGRQ